MWCKRAKLYKRAARRKSRKGEARPTKFGESVTCDHMVTKDANSQGIDAEKYCLTFYDDATRFTMAYPVGHRKHQDSLGALRDFEGPDPVIKSIYTDGAPEFVKMCKNIRPEGICHPTSTPGVSTSKARAERRNRHVLEGTRTALDRAGAGVKMWPYAAKHLFCREPARLRWRLCILQAIWGLA